MVSLQLRCSQSAAQFKCASTVRGKELDTITNQGSRILSMLGYFKVSLMPFPLLEDGCKKVLRATAVELVEFPPQSHFLASQGPCRCGQIWFFGMQPVETWSLKSKSLSTELSKVTGLCLNIRGPIWNFRRSKKLSDIMMSFVGPGTRLGIPTRWSQRTVSNH